MLRKATDKGMSRPVKVALDFLFGLIIPILILSHLSDDLGNILAYVTSTLVPVGWVVVDLLFVTRRFNFLTSFLALNAILRGILAFWFVDGAAYAFKDSASSLLWIVVFGVSLVRGRPLVGAFVSQGLDPRTLEQETSLQKLFDERGVRRALWYGTAAMVGIEAATTAFNFLLNLSLVTASFGTQAFNVQVAQVNAITRVAISIPETLALVVIIALAFRAIHNRPPEQKLPGALEDKRRHVRSLR